ncbi:magnesium transporter [Formivibrio citricus]|uniref:Magnesium transport protein CorA n=1 Tax=Formivibrio citricus TaxID=83765 RepID=A0A1I4YPL4_9NEIS|nr:magnesium/cobalt transporter CorA [Formivibrio citricus]SFN39917.1 magnesium transporter [Formivibrio citricus]
MARSRSNTQRHPRPAGLKVWPSAAKAGCAPGTLVYVGENEASETLATLIEYGEGENDYRETTFASLEKGRTFEPLYQTQWLNLHGLGNVDLLQLVGERFHLHPLVLEDILNTGQRPKVDVYPRYLFITTRLVHVSPEGEIGSEQICIILGAHYVLTIQEKPTGTFNSIRDSLKSTQAQIRKLGADYLVYALLDKLVDRYFSVLEVLGECIETLEEEISTGPKPEHLHRIQNLRRTLHYLKRGLWPLREVINTLQRDEADRFHPETQLYLRDVYDHTIQLIESVETLRDLVSGLQDTYLSLQTHHTNMQMRMLTAITTVFMPLTLIAGIYGMNFKFIPELEWHWGFYAVLGAMLVIGSSLGLYFRRRKWF